MDSTPQNLSPKALHGDIPARRARPSLRAQIRAADSLNSIEIERMYQIFSSYYEVHSKKQFVADLCEKDHVILLVDHARQTIQGFSTLLKVKMELGGRPIFGIYSGDTIVEKNFWGSAALGKAFLKYLFLEKLRHPFTPLYWFLISKGYKTYLLMANNFSLHYPRYERETPMPLANLMHEFYGKKFGEAYSAKTGLIEYPAINCHLKKSIADIEENLLQNPRVKFFSTRNPRWSRGSELACIAEMTFFMPLKYSLKKIFRKKS